MATDQTIRAVSKSFSDVMRAIIKKYNLPEEEACDLAEKVFEASMSESQNNNKKYVENQTTC